MSASLRSAGSPLRERGWPKGLICALLLLLVFLSGTYALSREGLQLPSPSGGERTALRLLRETVSLVEESYVVLPDLKKVYAEGLYGMQRSVGKDRLEVIRRDSRHYALRSGGKQLEVHLGGDDRGSLAAFKRGYRFVVAQAAPSSREGRELEIMYAALDGMVASLDSFSAFLPPEAFREMQVETRGRYGGIGITISLREKKLTVVSPIEDTPAFEAGIQAGDEIVAVDGEAVLGISLAQAVKRMRGPPGTKVRLSIMRAGWSAPREFTLVRAIIHIQSVKTRIFDGSIGYLRLTAFHRATTGEFDRGLKRLLEANIRGFILDLRNNPGGLLRQAVQVAERFLPERSMVVFTRGRHRDQTLHFRTQTDGVWVRRPLIVLINHGSASASEIVAGALQDPDRALLVGRTTFGKGSVQSIIPISHGAGVRLTTAKYYTPLGREIHQKGIRPDVEAEDPPPPGTSGRRARRPSSSFGDGTGAWPSPESDPALALALETLRETSSADVETLRLTASRVRAFRMGGVSGAHAPAAQGAR